MTFSFDNFCSLWFLTFWSCTLHSYLFYIFKITLTWSKPDCIYFKFSEQMTSQGIEPTTRGVLHPALQVSQFWSFWLFQLIFIYIKKERKKMARSHYDHLILYDSSDIYRNFTQCHKYFHRSIFVKKKLVS